MTNDPEVFLSHILTSIKAIEGYTKGVTEEQFNTDRKLQMATIKELEIIGEAVRNLPAEFKRENPAVPWRDIAGMRSFLVHEYFEIDLNIIWDTIKTKVPQFKSQVEEFLKALKD